MTSLVKAIQERLAKIVERKPDIFFCQPEMSGKRARAYLATAIRAADLSDLEPKEVDGKLVERLRDLAERIARRAPLMSIPVNVERDGDCLANQAADTIAALTASLEAKEAECEALRRDVGRFEWCLPMLTAQGDLGDARALALAAKFLKGLDGREAIDKAMKL